MRTVFSASGLLLALLFQAPVRAVEPAAPAASVSTNHPVANGKTRLDIRTPGGTRRGLWLARDGTVARRARPTAVEVVGELKATAIVLLDTYPSVSGSMSYCQAGEERFLRVISIVKPLPRETFRVKVASCRDDVELASPGIEWQPASATLRIHWLQGAAPKGMPEERTLVIGRDGKPARLP